MKRSSRTTLALVSAAAVVGLVAGPASAVPDQEISQAVEAGSLSAYVFDIDTDPVTFSHSSQSPSIEGYLNVDDTTGSYEGWRVTVEADTFTYAGSGGTGHDLPASALRLVSVDNPAWVAGQTVETGEVFANLNASGELDDPVVVLSSASGAGSYQQALVFELDLPAQTPVGTYTGQLITTILPGLPD